MAEDKSPVDGPGGAGGTAPGQSAPTSQPDASVAKAGGQQPPASAGGTGGPQGPVPGTDNASVPSGAGGSSAAQAGSQAGEAAGEAAASKAAQGASSAMSTAKTAQDAAKTAEAVKEGNMRSAALQGAKTAGSLAGPEGKAVVTAAETTGVAAAAEKAAAKGDQDFGKGDNKPGEEKPEAGAGGTSAKRKAKDDDGTVKKNSGGKKAATAAAAGAGGGALAAPIAFLMMIVQWLKAMFMAVMAAVANFIAALIAMVMAVVNFVVGIFMGIGGAIAGALGGAISAVTGAFSFGLALLMATVIAVAGGAQAVNSQEQAQRDVPVDPCLAVVKQREAVVTQQGGANVGTMDKNAEKIYSIMAGWGMPNENIAGILGNYEVESALDPTQIETQEGVEPYTYGPRKQEIETTTNFEVMKLAPEYAQRFPGVAAAKYVGIGLQQWTGQGDLNLREFARSKGKPWYDLELQMAFLRSPGSTSTDGDLTPFIQNRQPSPGDAAEYYMNKYERPATKTSPERRAAAERWYVKMSSWKADTALANSLLEQAGTAVSVANTEALASSVRQCGDKDQRSMMADNSSLAMAALSYAWPTTDQGKVNGPGKGGPYGGYGSGTGNDGTPLYQELHDYIFPGDPYYQSCDRGVATAVRWSGTDDTFPAGATPTQLQYLQTSPKWKEVKDWGGDPKNLQPGDVLIRADDQVGHIVLFVGSELVQKVFAANASPGANTVSASYGTRSPGAGVWYTGSEGLNTYHAFRSTGPEANSKYKSYVPKAAMMGNATGNTVPGGGNVAPGSIAIPTSGPVTSEFGMRLHPVRKVYALHTGIDIAPPCETPIVAAADGVVKTATNGTGYGNYVVIDHGQVNGVAFSTLYAHMSRRPTVSGAVKKGDIVGYVGTTGWSTGCHLHFETQENGNPVNPRNYLPGM